RRGAWDAMGSRARGGGGSRARALGGSRGIDRRPPGRPDCRSARRSDPHGGVRDRGAPNPQPGRADDGRQRSLRARVGLRPGDAPLSRRARHRARGSPGGRRPPAVRRPGVRALRRARAPDRRCAGACDAHRHRGGGALTPLRPDPLPALEGAAVEGASVALPGEIGGAFVGPSALQQLLARGRVRATLAMLGPAFVASVAYVDPGNFATNIQGGAQFGYLLLWVVLAANLMAMLIQYLSAKLGIVTDHDLPELCRAH